LFLSSLTNLGLFKKGRKFAAYSPQRPFCPLQELVAVQEMELSASIMIYGSESRVAVGPGPTVTVAAEKHCKAQSEAAQNSKDLFTQWSSLTSPQHQSSRARGQTPEVCSPRYSSDPGRNIQTPGCLVEDPSLRINTTLSSSVTHRILANL